MLDFGFRVPGKLRGYMGILVELKGRYSRIVEGRHVLSRSLF